MLIPLIWLFAGVALLAYGADRLVAGSSAIALRTGVSPLLVGLTIVAIATSSPELLVSLVAAFQGSSAIAVGNVIGSNIANIALVLGGAALIFPVKGEDGITRRELPLMVFVMLFLSLLMYNQMITRAEGIAMCLMLGGFLIYQIRVAQAQMDAFEDTVQEVMQHQAVPMWLAVFYVVLGTACLYFGSEAFLKGAVELGEILGISEAVIGLSIVSVGTSLPELATTVAAALKKQTDMALGNIVGSNIFNVLAVLGITGAIIPLQAGSVSLVDLGFMMMLSLLLWGLMVWKKSIGRLVGGLLLLSYIAYIIFLLQS